MLSKKEQQPSKSIAWKYRYSLVFIFHMLGKLGLFRAKEPLKTGQVVHSVNEIYVCLRWIAMHKPGTDASLVRFLRIIRNLGLMNNKTYQAIGAYMIKHGADKKNAWRQANWKSFLAGG